MTAVRVAILAMAGAGVAAVACNGRLGGEPPPPATGSAMTGFGLFSGTGSGAIGGSASGEGQAGSPAMGGRQGSGGTAGDGAGGVAGGGGRSATCPVTRRPSDFFEPTAVGNTEQFTVGCGALFNRPLGVLYGDGGWRAIVVPARSWLHVNLTTPECPSVIPTSITMSGIVPLELGPGARTDAYLHIETDDPAVLAIDEPISAVVGTTSFKLTPTDVDFGVVLASNASSDLVIVTNTGEAPIVGLALAGGPSVAFSVHDWNQMGGAGLQPLEPGKSALITILVFSPQAGLYQDDLVLTPFVGSAMPPADPACGGSQTLHVQAQITPSGPPPTIPDLPIPP